MDWKGAKLFLILIPRKGLYTHSETYLPPQRLAEALRRDCCHPDYVRRSARKVILRRAQRNFVIKVMRGYRTITFKVALTIVGMIPLDLPANAETTD